MRRITSILTVLTVLTVLPSYAQSYPDINPNDWFKPYVEEATELGLFQGYPDGRFGPWDPTNRAELAKAMIELKNSLQQNWLQDNAFEIILVFITLIGWGSILAAVRKLAQPTVVVESKKNESNPPEYPFNQYVRATKRGIKRNYRPYQTPPRQNEETPSPHPELKNRASNWWV
ncbi:MAG: S-layer homology domain-containing protein [bacterium]|nr:S-layer homology domain-containing protein [bacterium]